MDSPQKNNQRDPLQMSFGAFYSFSNPRSQNISFPYGMKTHIFKNYTAKAYEKLMKTCKLFIGQNRIHVVDRIENGFDGHYGIMCNNDFALSENEQVKLNLQKLEVNKIKLWITNFMNFTSIFTKASDLLNFIFQNDCVGLILFYQELFLNEYIKLVN